MREWGVFKRIIVINFLITLSGGEGGGGGEIHYNYYDNPLNIDQNIQTSYMNRSL